MENWTSGYVADINYTYGFYRELTPAILSLVALVKGQHGPNAAAPLTYCELGCGQGVSTNLLAAANPHIRFYATDFNPSQIAGARMLADEAGLENVHFYDESFADFADVPSLPESFDIIALHGIYSWISAENRATIIDFIRRKLKVGGLVYMSYNALPGWAPMMPLRRLFVDHAATTHGAMAGRIDQALQHAERLMLAKSRYFLVNSPVVARFDQIKGGSKNYLAHEYFNRDWTPFYAADVFDELAAAKLGFVGSAAFLDHVDQINFTAEQLEMLREISDPGRKETMRDYLINQQFRRDVFQKGHVGLSIGAAHEAWLNHRFALCVPRDGFDMTIKGVLGEAELQSVIYGPLLDAFATGPKTLREIFAGHALNETGWGQILQAIAVLMGAGRLEPCLPAKDEAKRARSTKAFNQALMARARENSDIQFLASPVTGGGVAVSRFQQLFLLALQNGQKTPEDWANFAWAILAGRNQGIVKDGTVLTTPEENLAEMGSQAEEFAAKQLPVLKSLQVG